MKLKAEQLAQHLQQPLKPIYLVSGDEPLLVQECTDAIRTATKEQQILEREVYYVEAGFDWNTLLAAGSELSLFADRKFIEVRVNQKLNDAGRKTLVAMASDPNPDNVMLIVTGKLDSASTRAKWFKTLEEASVHVQIWPLDRQRLPQWLTNRAKQQGMTITSDALALLADRVDGNLLAAQQEIDKLALLADNQTIDAELVVQSVSDSSRYDVFDLTDACLTGDSPRALKILAGLRSEGIEPPVVLWALSRELRSLSIINSQLAQGQPAAQVFRKQGIWDKRQPAVNRALNRISTPLLHQLLQLAGDIDMAIKGARQGDTWDELSSLVFNLAAGENPIGLPS